VSAAYYALFHFLTDAIAAQSAAGQIALRRRIARSFAHGELKDVCLAVANASKSGWAAPPARVADLFVLPLATAIATAADTFVQLQESRHAADYDLGRSLTREEVQYLIDSAADAISGLRRLARTPNMSAFLAALAFAKRWDK